METITIQPKTKRAKDRVRQHGNVMELLKCGTFDGKPAVLVKSVKRTWAGNQHWKGWFTDDEVGSVVK